MVINVQWTYLLHTCYTWIRKCSSEKKGKRRERELDEWWRYYINKSVYLWLPSHLANWLCPLQQVICILCALCVGNRLRFVFIHSPENHEHVYHSRYFATRDRKNKTTYDVLRFSFFYFSLCICACADRSQKTAMHHQCGARSLSAKGIFAWIAILYCQFSAISFAVVLHRIIAEWLGIGLALANISAISPLICTTNSWFAMDSFEWMWCTIGCCVCVGLAVASA